MDVGGTCNPAHIVSTVSAKYEVFVYPEETTESVEMVCIYIVCE